MHSLKSLNYPEVIPLLVATSSLQDPLICTTEEPQSLLICRDQIRATFELRTTGKLSSSGMQEMNDTVFNQMWSYISLLLRCLHVKDLHGLCDH